MAWGATRVSSQRLNVAFVLVIVILLVIAWLDVRRARSRL